MQITRRDWELVSGTRTIAVCANARIAQWIESLLEAVARLDGNGDERAETIAMIQAVMALRALEKEARQ